ncbi:hypothetical protein ABMA32_13030 [Mesorhizobium sp. VNQ89]|uniref:hypothetical protein n=1 Tax=Mesorhizobium quangtriensis TaxID=3157709 RepID=UPI0032B75A89
MFSELERNSPDPIKMCRVDAIYVDARKILAVNVLTWLVVFGLGIFFNSNVGLAASAPLFTAMVGAFFLEKSIKSPKKFLLLTVCGVVSTFTMTIIYTKYSNFPPWMYGSNPESFPMLAFYYTTIYLLSLIVMVILWFFLLRLDETDNNKT